MAVLVACDTDPAYLEYLSERRYPFFAAGSEHVMLAEALPWMAETFGVRRVLVDSGPILTHVMLDHDLVDEISLLVHPTVIGDAGRRVLEGSVTKHRLNLVAATTLEYGVVHLHYQVGDVEPA